MRSWRRWLTPGMGIKRWLGVVFLGELAIALAGALLLLQVYRAVRVAPEWQPLVSLLTLQSVPDAVRGLMLAGAGAVLLAFGFVSLMRVLVGPNAGPEPLSELIYQRRMLSRGPRIVAIGGGTGLSVLLRGLKTRTSNLTAIVSVADDGGSSGRLREAYGWTPMGDIRNCIAALADAEPLMTDLLQYRFPADPADPGPGLEGHAVGNLLIAAMSAIEDDFEEGVRQVNRVLAVRGQVIPASGRPLTLHARLGDGSRVDGQSAIQRSGDIERVWITPADPPASAGAIEAIDAADIVVLGPGSLYTSVLPSLLVPAIGDAVRRAPGLVIWVCNVATQVGETDGYDLAQHYLALERHAGPELIDVVLANSATGARRAAGDEAAPVRLTWPPGSAARIEALEARGKAARGAARPADDPAPDAALVLRDVVDPENAHFHDPDRLAAAVVEVAALRLRRRSVGASLQSA
jgi:uncharacterized cofD-like protein